MPMYEYECSKCNRVLEVIQKFSDPALTECPECKGPVQKLLSRTSFQLKGSGWYATDYKKSSTSSPSQTPADTSAKPADTATKPAGGCGAGGCGHSTHGKS